VSFDFPDFAPKLVAWQRLHGRHDLPWQGTRDPYRIWVSEIMLQQTQVGAVIGYFERFMRRFPDLKALATATEDEVLQLWSGLGYYARARNLHAAARKIVDLHNEKFPADLQLIQALPGIGRSTAAAIAVFAFGQRAAILDGNVKRVLARRFGVEGFPGMKKVEARLWDIATSLLPNTSDNEAYTQGLMDLGATVCTRSRPSCDKCPMAADCVALNTGRTGELPSPRPRKDYPTREATWLVLRQSGQVLLERRASSGLWGGLWTFPEFDHHDLAGYCESEFGCVLSGRSSLESFAHGFTHFRLEISPVICAVTRRHSHAESPGRAWMGIDEAIGAAVPVPVRKVLKQLL
jgi:A/G-specific adenine glycosylase